MTVLAGGLFMLFLSAGCSRQAVPQDTSGALRITAAFYPQYIMCLNLTQNVTGVELSLLVPDTTLYFSDYRLTTKDLAAVSSCDIFVINGAGMEQFLRQAQKIKPDTLITAAEKYSPVNNNPYIWLSPSGAISEVQQIAEGLAGLDPAHAEKYKENADLYEKKLSRLSDEMHTTLDKYKGCSIIIFDEPFRYLAAEFDLHAVLSIDRRPGAVPDKKELAANLHQIKNVQKNCRSICLYAELQYPRSSGETIETETGLPINRLDLCVTGECTPDAYINAQEKNLLILRQSLSGNYDDGENP